VTTETVSALLVSTHAPALVGYIAAALGSALVIGIVFLGGRYAWRAFKSIR